MAPPPAAAALPARRVSGRQNDQQLSILTQNEVQRTNDPAMQQRARAHAGIGDIPVGRFSNEDERANLVGERMENRKRKKKRKMGENARSVGEQGDAVAFYSMRTLTNAFGRAVDTLHYPNLQPGEPTHESVLITLRTIEESNRGGGRLTSRRSERPVLTCFASSQSAFDNVLGVRWDNQLMPRKKAQQRQTVQSNTALLVCRMVA